MAGEVLKRCEIEDKYKWHLEDLYATDQLAEADIAKIPEMATEIAGYKGHLSDSAETLYKCVTLVEDMDQIISKVFCYARMHRDEDGSVTNYQAMSAKCMAAMSDAMSKLAFFTPELIAIPDDKLAEYMEFQPLKMFHKYMEYILRTKAHVLSKEQETVLAAMAEATDAPSEIFTVFTNTNMPFPTITNEDGQQVQLSQGRYTSFLESDCRRVREEAFNKMYDTYGQYIDTFATIYGYECKNHVNDARIRSYSSALEAALYGDNISTDVYNNLIETIHKNLPTFHRYIALRKKLLGVDELHMYDLYTPLVTSDIKNIPYEKAQQMVLDGLAVLGEDYGNLLKEAYSNGWIDVYENVGKRSGAYSWGAYGTHPYVCLNYQGSINDVCTIAHELGHSMHTYKTNNTQPYIYSSYTLFVAEVASTVNEVLLLTDMINKTTDKRDKAFLINHFLEECRGTLFRQTMFAEFERNAHQMVENGQPLTAEALNQMYYDLNKLYFGDDIVVDEKIKYEWSRIPHFYRNFYVYKYATGFSAANALASGILAEGQPALDKYFGFLSAGCSDYSLNILKAAGVDMTSPAPVQATCDKFAEMLDMLEELTAEISK